MEKYFINENTLAVLPYSKNQSKVIENYITYIVNQLPFDIINDSCMNYGSSFLGRSEATEFMIGVKYKCPIIISEVKEIIMFPTTSAKNSNCVWINYGMVEKYYNNDCNETILVLKSGAKLSLNVSNRIISNQIFKSSRLESVMKSKKQ